MMRPRTLLITAFEPFAERRENASEILLNQAPSSFESAGGTTLIERRVLPVSYDEATPALARHLDSVRPDTVLALGEAKEPVVRIERLARGWSTSKKPDNRGVVRSSGTEGPTLPSRFDLEALLEGLLLKRIPARLSDDAGGFVCNHIFFALQKMAAELGFPRASGFIHVPIDSRALFSAEDFWCGLLPTLCRPES